MQFIVAKTLLRISASIEEWLAATTFVKYCTLKKLFPAINYKEKMIFRNNYSTLDHSLFLESLLIISLRFLYINSRALEKGVNYVQS